MGQWGSFLQLYIAPSPTLRVGTVFVLVMFLRISLPFLVWTWTGNVSLGQFSSILILLKLCSIKINRNGHWVFSVVIEMVCFIQVVKGWCTLILMCTSHSWSKFSVALGFMCPWFSNVILEHYVYVQTDWATIFSFVCSWLTLVSSTYKPQEIHWVDHNLPSRLLSFLVFLLFSGSSNETSCCPVYFCLRLLVLLCCVLTKAFFFPSSPCRYPN